MPPASAAYRASSSFQEASASARRAASGVTSPCVRNIGVAARSAAVTAAHPMRYQSPRDFSEGFTDSTSDFVRPRRLATYMSSMEAGGAENVPANWARIT